MDPKHAVFVNHRRKITNGVHKINSDVPFMFPLTNFSNTGRKISKQMELGYATRNPMLIIILRLDSSLEAHAHESLGLANFQKANRMHNGKNSSPPPQNQSKIHAFLQSSETVTK